MQKILLVSMVLAILTINISCDKSEDIPTQKQKNFIVRIIVNSHNTNDGNSYSDLEYVASIEYPNNHVHIISDFHDKFIIPDTISNNFADIIYGCNFELKFIIQNNYNNNSPIWGREYYFKSIMLHGTEDTITIQYPQDTLKAESIKYWGKNFSFVKNKIQQ